MRNCSGCGGVGSGMRAENSDLQRERERERRLGSRNSGRPDRRRRGGAQRDSEQRRGALALEVTFLATTWWCWEWPAG
ncbi:hypothetical protein U1Q18_008846 [Sarracenia purpurea var. burkii]